MKSVKERARQLIDSLPDDASWGDLMYALYVHKAIEAGIADAEAGRIATTSEVRSDYGLQP